MRPRVDRPDVGGEDLDAGMAGLHRLGELVEMRRRHLAHQRQVEAVVAVARRPSSAPASARSTAAACASCAHCTKSIRVVVPPYSAALLTCDGGSVSTIGSPLGRRASACAMDVRVDAAGNDDLAGRVDAARRVRQRARRADRGDASVLDADVGGTWFHSAARRSRRRRSDPASGFSCRRHRWSPDSPA